MMKLEKAEELYETYLNGNITVFKTELNKLTKKELLDFAYYVNTANGDGLYLCTKYLEDYGEANK
jgi:hypothetical protein